MLWGFHMRNSTKVLLCAALSSGLLASAVAAEDSAATAKIAALSDFGAKLDVLEQAVDDITVTGALALLASEFPDWEFGGASGFGSVKAGATNDLGAVAASHEYGMGKLRGALFRNKHASDAQREAAMQILAEVKDLILVGYELEKLVEADDMPAAGQVYREKILTQSDKLNEDLEALTKEIEQGIKFSAL